MLKYLHFERFSSDKQYMNELKDTQEGKDNDIEEKDKLQK